MMRELIEHLLAPHLYGKQPPILADAAVVNIPSPLAFTTDSFVVSPLFFPGGNIGSLAVHGTVNDLAVMGATPRLLSVGFILEEGLPMESLAAIVASLGEAARLAGMQVVTGDTKVVEKQHGDGIYINTTGLGTLVPYNPLAPGQIRPGDALVVNGHLGDHGLAIMCQRAGLEFETEILSDSAPLHTLVSAMLAASPEIRFMRDLTRGGLAAAVNELAREAGLGLEIDEARVPISPPVSHACELLGLDVLEVANEGKLLAVVPETAVHPLLAAMQAHPLGAHSAVIGEVVATHPGTVVCRTAIGSRRVIDLPLGVLLPRIC